MLDGLEVDSFAHLGLAPDADARAIRRAYARALKKIDQALDADGFQQLRNAYETALLCAESGVAEVVAPAPAAVQEAVPDQLTDAVAEAFCAVVAALGANTPAAHAVSAPYEQALRQALADERLFGIEARCGFQRHVAVLLAEGWRPGHHALFVAAAEVFDWSDGKALAGLGAVGMLLDRAVFERALFDRQPMSVKDMQRRVLKRLREEQLPSASQLHGLAPAFRRMQECFPFWLPIVAPQERIAYWEEHCPAPYMAYDTPPEVVSWPGRIAMACICLAAIFGVGQLASRPPHPHAPFVVDAPAAAEVAGMPFTQQRVDDIVARIALQLGHDAVRTALVCEFQVMLDAGGRVVTADVLSSSGDPRVDAAVRSAILGSAPFPPETSRETVFTYRHTPP